MFFRAPADVDGQESSPSRYYSRLYRRILTSHEFAEPPELFAAKMGISQARTLLVELPASRSQGGGGLAFEVFDHKSRSLLQVSHDRVRAERAKGILRRELPFDGHIWAEDADFLADAHAWKIATPEGVEVGAFLFPHLDRPSTNSYVSSRFECFLLTDFQNRLVFFNPPCRCADGPRRLDLGNLFLPIGLFWVRVSTKDPTKRSGVFSDAAGRPFATTKALEDRLPATGGQQTRLDLTSSGTLLGPLLLQMFMYSRRALQKRTEGKQSSGGHSSG